MKEIWKDIEGYEGLYKISNFGNVKSIFVDQASKEKEQILKTTKSSTGYIHVQLYKDGKSSTVNIHRLVAIAFIPNPFNKPEVNHIDSDRTNNNASNLEWVTHSENIKHSINFGNRDMSVLWTNKKRKYKILQYSLNGEFIAKWDRIEDIMSMYNSSKSSIYACLNGRHKSSCGYIWVKLFENDQVTDHIPKRIIMTGKTQQRIQRKIVQCDKQGSIIRVWNNYLEIINNPMYGANSLANIIKCANGKRKSAYGFIWKYI